MRPPSLNGLLKPTGDSCEARLTGRASNAGDSCEARLTGRASNAGDSCEAIMANGPISYGSAPSRPRGSG